MEHPNAAYDPVTKQILVAYIDNSNDGAAVLLANNSFTSTLTAENFIGFSDAAYSDGDTATIQIVGSVDDAQSSLTAGQQYFVQGDGSLSLTAGTSASVVAGTAVSATKIIVKG